MGATCSMVLDAELVAVDPSGRIRAFQELSTRKRSDVTAAEVEVQVCIFVFDLLQWRGRSLASLPLAERRCRLKEALTCSVNQVVIAESIELNLLEEAKVERRDREAVEKADIGEKGVAESMYKQQTSMHTSSFKSEKREAGEPEIKQILHAATSNSEVKGGEGKRGVKRRRRGRGGD